MANEAQQEPQPGQDDAKPESRIDIFNRHRATVEGRAGKDTSDRGRRGDSDQGDKGAQQSREAQPGDDRDPDLKDVPPELYETAVKIKKSLKADHTRKTQALSQDRKKVESDLKEHQDWAPAREAWGKADSNRRRAIEMAYEGKFDDVASGRGPAQAGARDQGAGGPDDLDEMLAEFDEDSRPVAKKLIQLAEKRLGKAAGGDEKDDIIRELKQRLDKIESTTAGREKAENDAYAQRQYAAFLEAVPDYEGLEEDAREDFEDFFEAKLAKNPELTPVEAWKRWNGHVEARADVKTRKHLDNLASRADRAPVIGSGNAGVSRLPDARGLTRREIFKSHAAKRQIIVR